MNGDTNLIDISMLQQLQDQFCCADHLYLMCVDKNKGVVTKPFGTEEQVGFLRTQVDKHAYMELLSESIICKISVIARLRCSWYSIASSETELFSTAF